MGLLSRAGDILVRAGVIDELQHRSAAAHQAQWGGSLTHALVELGLAAEEDIVAALADAMKLPRVSLDRITADALLLSKTTVHFCEQRHVFPAALKDQGKTLVLAMADPTDLSVIDEAMGLARCRIQPVLAGELEIERA